MEAVSIFLALDYFIQPCSSLSNMASLDLESLKYKPKEIISEVSSPYFKRAYIYKEFQNEHRVSTSFSPRH